MGAAGTSSAASPPSRVAQTSDQPAVEKKFGTLTGVFRPTVLTILGALLYLRQGYVVGHAGLGGFLLILISMYVITASTALSMSSMTSNIRIGRGGVFSIISQSFGLEAGGAIAVPFYLAQSMGAALYLYAFAEAWAMFFPSHPTGVVVPAAFVAVATLAALGAKLAFKAQSIVMLGTLAAFVSMAVGLASAPGTHAIEFYHHGEDMQSLPALFALFFPAATGILVGASMSGSLADARKSIPVGTIAAVAVSFVVYVLAGFWFAVVASPDLLRNSTTVAFDLAASPPIVVGGVLASTFSAALSSMVAAPRVLHALASYGITPYAEVLQRQTASGEPRIASLVTALIVSVSLLTGSLDRIAPLLTVFFLITYASLNIVVLIEHWLGLPSFRPTFRTSLAAPAVGAGSSLLAILVTSPVFGLVALSFVIVLYAWLVRRRLPTHFETARSGMLVNIAAWAAQKIGELPSSTERSWKPDLLVPVTRPEELAGAYRLLRAIVGTKGSILVVGLSEHFDPRQAAALDRLSLDLLDAGINSKATWAEAPNYAQGAAFAMSVLDGAFLPPNIVFLSLNSDVRDLQTVVEMARQRAFGVVIRVPHEVAGLGRERAINVWIRDQSPDWNLSLKMASIDLSLLLALQLRGSWGGRLRLMTVADAPENVEPARHFLTDLWVQARVPGPPEVHVLEGSFAERIDDAPQADLNIFGMPRIIDADGLTETATSAGSTCLFVLASGRESALA